MIIYKTNDNKKLIRFSHCDVTILFMISLGATSCSDIAEVLGKTKQAISNKVDKFARYDIVESREVPVKGRYREYTLTEKGRSWLDTLLTSSAWLFVD